MPNLIDLYKKHIGQDIYIIGTGPSFALFPKKWLDRKITIGLNQSYKLFSPKYSLTIHPYLIPTNHIEWNTLWLTKTKVSDESWSEHLKRGNDKRFFIFHKNKNPLDFSYLSPARRPKNGLYVGCGIHTGAMHLAALMGASNIHLVGCDFGHSNYNHHCHSQHIEFHCMTPEEVYLEYYFYAEKVRQELEFHYKIDIFQLSYSLGIPKYTGIAIEKLGLTQENPPVIIEKNVRTIPLIRDFIQ